MNENLERRHSRWYEQIVFNTGLQLLVGLFLVVMMPVWLRWGDYTVTLTPGTVYFNTLLANTLAFISSFIILRSLQRFPGVQTFPFILSTIALSWLIVFAVLLFLREEYSRPALLDAFILANAWGYFLYFLGQRFSVPKFALVPAGRATSLSLLPEANWQVLESTDLKGHRYDAVVADLGSDELTPEWENFLARCTLAHIPVFHFKQVQESITGRVQVDHLSENVFGTLLPSASYSWMKRVLETFLVLVLLPLWLPLILLVGLIIKLESKGSMFFTQERVGQGGNSFKVYKLRSMAQNSEQDGARFAADNDMRVTRVGRVIRKTRIDEIPQFINVLRGDMSLIGPRPEQLVFVRQFEKEIPFYVYRHVVKPGITGWAQVMQGYVADAEDTRVKIEHDFYYIKHFSFWLDFLIVLKTIKTILTGFGAR